MPGLLSTLRDWRDRRQIFRDVRRQQAEDDERLYFKIKDDLTYALQALERDDIKQATDIWTRLLAAHPRNARASPLALKVLIGLRRFEEADALMQAGQRQHPNDPFFARGRAEVAQAKRDFDVAMDHCAFLRKRFPGVVEGYTIGANALVQKGQLDLAEALAIEAITRFPDYIGGPLEYAGIAVKRGDWEEALRRWQPVGHQFGHYGGYVGSAQALTRLGRYEEAEALLEQARCRFGSTPAPLSELARVAEAKGNIIEAVERWKAVLSRFPLDMPVYFSVSEAMERLGEAPEAEAVLRAAIDRFPAELRPPLELAKFLQFKRRDFSAAAEVWATIRGTSPDKAEAYTWGADALRKAGRVEEADTLQEHYKSRFSPAK